MLQFRKTDPFRKSNPFNQDRPQSGNSYAVPTSVPVLTLLETFTMEWLPQAQVGDREQMATNPHTQFGVLCSTLLSNWKQVCTEAHFPGELGSKYRVSPDA